jgi:hypothetical protein
MHGPDVNNRTPSEPFSPVPSVTRLAQRARRSSDPVLVIWTDEFGEALRRKILLRRWRDAQPPLTAEDLNLHAWLNERLATIRSRRHGLWPRFWRFLFGNRLVRWLGRLRRVR